MIALKPVDEISYQAVLDLKVAEEDTGFVAQTCVHSLTLGFTEKTGMFSPMPSGRMNRWLVLP